MVPAAVRNEYLAILSTLQTTTRKRQRPFLRVAGLLTIVAGLVLIIVGTGSFLIHFFSHSGGGLPWLFLLSFIGWPLLFTGNVMFIFSFMGSSARNKAIENARGSLHYRLPEVQLSMDKAYMKIPPLLPRPRPPDWMTRNWKWFVPLLSLIGLACIGIFVALVLTLVKSSDAYSGAVVRAESSPAVIAALGTPIKNGYYFTGHISENNSSGSANLVIPISGPNGSANLYVSASRSLSKWHFDELVVEINKTKQRIDISDTNQLPVATPSSGNRPVEKQ